ncbi:hypothetical protein BMS3Bbin14_00071 [bacterium BMS3Bbin14]|nr:hypothetical protein BMS3Bbin14_00071 [bacterium BMS3Bbin14]
MITGQGGFKGDIGWSVYPVGDGCEPVFIHIGIGKYVIPLDNFADISLLPPFAQSAAVKIAVQSPDIGKGDYRKVAEGIFELNKLHLYFSYMLNITRK